MVGILHGLCRSAPSPYACVGLCVCASSLQHNTGASSKAAVGPANHKPLEKFCLPPSIYLTVPPSCYLSLWLPFYILNLYLWLSSYLFCNLSLFPSIGHLHFVSISPSAIASKTKKPCYRCPSSYIHQHTHRNGAQRTGQAHCYYYYYYRHYNFHYSKQS